MKKKVLVLKNFIRNSSELIISKRIILSGDNLVDAQPRMDNQSNQTVVTFSLDRVGAKSLLEQHHRVLEKDSYNIRWKNHKRLI